MTAKGRPEKQATCTCVGAAPQGLMIGAGEAGPAETLSAQDQ